MIPNASFQLPVDSFILR